MKELHDIRYFEEIDYYPFGMGMPVRSFSIGGIENYGFGFNDQEKDNEIYGMGNLYSALFWGYDPRLGRRWNVDPVNKFYQSSYVSFSNNPLVFIDPNGNDDFFNNKGELILHTNTTTNNIYIITMSDESFLNTHVVGLEKYDDDEDLANQYIVPFALQITRFIINDEDPDYNYALIKKIFEYYYYQELNSKQKKDGVDFYFYNALPGALAATHGYNFDIERPFRADITFGLDIHKIPTILEDANNLKNLMVHERAHANHDRNLCTSCPNSTDRNVHLGVYFTQITDETWENTTEEWKEYIIDNIGSYINDVFEDDYIKTLTQEDIDFWNKTFGEKLGGNIILNSNYTEGSDEPKYILNKN